MIRTSIAAAGASVLLASSLAPTAAAAATDQVISVHDGKIRCLLSTDDVPRGGGPMAVCDVVDGRFGIAPMSTGKYPQRLNLAVVRGGGELFWMAGTLPPPGNDVVLGVGDSYRANGWSVRNDDFRTFIINDYSRHGMTVNPTEARASWP